MQQDINDQKKKYFNEIIKIRYIEIQSKLEEYKMDIEKYDQLTEQIEQKHKKIF